MTTPVIALSISYALHMIATVVWFGALLCINAIFLPGLRALIPADQFMGLLRVASRRMQSIGWLALTLLVGTGLIQMSASPHYEGLIVIENQWSVAILAKHIVFTIIIAISAYQTWGILPKIERALLIQKSRRDQPKDSIWLLDQERQLVSINFALGIIVIILTALARTA